MLSRHLAYNLVGKEGNMAGRIDCCRYEPSLDELLDDEVMAPVLRSAGYDADGLRDMMVETARRIDDQCGNDQGGLDGRYHD
jgi:hypothetical protein